MIVQRHKHNTINSSRMGFCDYFMVKIPVDNLLCYDSNSSTSKTLDHWIDHIDILAKVVWWLSTNCCYKYLLPFFPFNISSSWFNHMVANNYLAHTNYESMVLIYKSLTWLVWRPLAPIHVVLFTWQNIHDSN